jgi:hypothetical protein
MPPRSRGPYRRLARQFREAGLMATAEEVQRLESLAHSVRDDSLCVFEAQRILRDVIRGQHERHQRAA